MVRQEQTGTRNLDFSQWVRQNLPDTSTGFLASDIDFILYNYKSRRFLTLEVKTNGAQQPRWQQLMFQYIEKFLVQGTDPDWTYLGHKHLEFSGTEPTDGSIKLNGVPIDQLTLKRILSLA